MGSSADKTQNLNAGGEVPEGFVWVMVLPRGVVDGSFFLHTFGQPNLYLIQAFLG
jgi:hypothetical protein